ncbi:nucleotide sugar dehydrogenase [Hypoxylon rubiginosum]|uniref:Nucleotide sugar dehydrogenase n=1 Tax=Hypoxylon rubiginosum TaxID=110542 RepID=A0ACC0D4X8_9PEZI|nr:nucleotide sugar dehydrogenase [Hypoxylon rubiginosum]
MIRPVTNICCVGAGYVGGPTAAIMAYQNPHLRVTVVDNNEQRIRRWNSEHLPIYEPGLGDIVRIARDGSRQFQFTNKPIDQHQQSTSLGQNFLQHDEQVTVPARSPNLFFSTQVGECIREADIVLIAVNTPSRTKGVGAGSATNMSSFNGVARVVAQHARPGAIIVEKSTVPCMTSKSVKRILALYRPGIHFEILSNPEFLAAGSAMKDLMYPERVLIGSELTPTGRLASAALASVYAAWVPPSRIITVDIFSSELVKLVANSMLAQRVSSINSVSALCEKVGADIDAVASILGADSRIGDKFLKAGIGFGGSCFKKDLLGMIYLAETVHLPEVAEYWRQVIVMNEFQRDRFVRRVVACFDNCLASLKITLLGYAFKANTSDTRETPALGIIKMLLHEDPVEIAIFDPCCNPEVVKAEIKALIQDEPALKEDGGPIVVYSDAYDACAGSDAVLITTDFDEFRSTPKEGEPTAESADPRPFPPHLHGPTETEILSLHKYLLSVPSSADKIDDPLGRYLPEPACESNCPDCGLIKTSGYSTAGNTDENRPKIPLDWQRIVVDMNPPKLLFDGKGIIDAEEMSELGFQVERIGH